MNKIKAILIDIGGVLIRTSDRKPRQKWEQRLGLSDQGLDNLVFGCEAAQLSTIGKSSPKQVWKSVQDILNITDAELHELQNDFWSNDVVDLKLLDVLRRLHSHYQIFIISNAWQDARKTFSNLFMVREGDLFDKIFISSELGLAKPNPEIFNQVAKIINYYLDEILFIDDFIENIQVAKKLGMQTIHFQDANEVISQLITMVE